MKNIVIAAGYATRLGELTKNFPKPLLKIGENTILGRMLDDIDRIPEIDEHIIISNHRFAPIFDKWKMEDGRWKKPITIVDDGTETNETRLGAVCDLMYAMDKLHIDDDMLVAACVLLFSFAILFMSSGISLVQGSEGKKDEPAGKAATPLDST